MNERIRELIKECTATERGVPIFFRFSDAVINHDTPRLDVEKFAKMLIEDCIEQFLSSVEGARILAEDKNKADIQRIICGTIVGCTTNGVDRVKKHFGVEQ